MLDSAMYKFEENLKKLKMNDILFLNFSLLSFFYLQRLILLKPDFE